MLPLVPAETMKIVQIMRIMQRHNPHDLHNRAYAASGAGSGVTALSVTGQPVAVESGRTLSSTTTARLVAWTDAGGSN